MHSSEHFVSRLNLLRNLIIKVHLFHLHDWQFLPDVVIGHLQVALRSLVSQNPPFSHRNPTHNVFSLKKNTRYSYAQSLPLIITYSCHLLLLRLDSLRKV